jgi:hypothetical protein
MASSFTRKDDFFVDSDNGDNVAVVTEAPADQYQSDLALFDQLRQSLSMN